MTSDDLAIPEFLKRNTDEGMGALAALNKMLEDVTCRTKS